jgi:natural product precursor
MKKISLKNLNLKDVDQLSREQLKNVLGGYSNGTTGVYCDESLTTGVCVDSILDDKGCILYNIPKPEGDYPCYFQNGNFFRCTMSQYMCDSVTGKLGD